MEDDEFLTIKLPGQAQTRVMASRFLGVAVPCCSADDFEQKLETERKHYFDATHWCWAHRLGIGSSLIEKSSDAGEPHGTAGLPILRELQSHQLTDCGVIVTRYYGGTKLGTGNLGRAYGECAALALDNSEFVTRTILVVLYIDCPFDDQGTVYHWSAQHQAIVEQREVLDHAAFTVKIHRREIQKFTQRLVDSSSGRISFREAGQWIS
jgi:uncharacterized YigZ family protein